MYARHLGDGRHQPRPQVLSRPERNLSLHAGLWMDRSPELSEFRV